MNCSSYYPRLFPAKFFCDKQFTIRSVLRRFIEFDSTPYYECFYKTFLKNLIMYIFSIVFIDIYLQCAIAADQELRNRRIDSC